jgi:osmotically-inducible protein OsmY
MRNDSLIKQDVEEEFASEAGLDPSKIKLKLNNGVLQISGIVGSLSEKLVAEHAASRVVGEESVRSSLKVKLPAEARRWDSDIRSSCQTALFESYGAPRGAVEPIVVDGRVTLEGHVRSKYERDAALHAIYEVRGIVEVINHIRIESPSNTDNLRKSARSTI